MLLFRLGRCCLFVPSLILLLRESDSGSIFWTNLHSLRSCPFPTFSVVSFVFLPFNLLLVVRSHQAEIIIVKRLIQGRNNVFNEGG